MIRSRTFLFACLSFSLLLSACGTKTDLGAHFSNEGLVPEAYIPNDVAMVLSYSTRDDEQYSAIQAIDEALGGEDRVSQTAAEAFQSQLADTGLDFEKDLKPAFGDQFRLVYAIRSQGEGEPENFAVITLEDPSQMKTVLETLKENEKLTYKKLSTIDAYIAESDLYLGVHEDLLFMSSTPENLVAMAEMEEENSLWGKEAYRDRMEEIGSNYLLYVVLYPALYTSESATSTNILLDSFAEEQVMVARAEDKGIRFNVFVKANEEEAKKAGITLDSVPRPEPYLFEEVPADGLVFYYEAYGIKQSFEQAQQLSGPSEASLEELEKLSRSYFGMDLAELMGFMDKGYAMAFHQNADNVVPGITFYVDVSSDPEQAEAFANKLDGQLSGVLLMVEQILPGAVTKDTVEWNGATFSRLKMDLSALPQSQESALPESVKNSVLQIVYGLQNDRLILSTATGWDSEGESIADSEFYQKLKAKNSEEEGGLVLVNTQELAEFFSAIQEIQSELAPTEEVDKSIQEFLKGFLGFIGQSESEKYEGRFGGFLMLAD